MQQFFGEVSAIKLSLAGIREAQGRLSALHERSKTVTRGRELAALREQMQEEIEGVSRQAHGVKARLERLEKSNSASLAREGCGPGSSTERSRSAITAALRKKLRDLMGEDFFLVLARVFFGSGKENKLLSLLMLKRARKRAANGKERSESEREREREKSSRPPLPPPETTITTNHFHQATSPASAPASAPSTARPSSAASSPSRARGRRPRTSTR